MKNMKKLIPALAMLVLSAVMMSTASFAWFSMNSSVAVKNINVNTVAPVYVSIRTNTTENNGTWGTEVIDGSTTVLQPADVNVVDNKLTSFLVVNNFKTTGGGGIVGPSAENKYVNQTDVVAADATGTVKDQTGKAFVKFVYDFTLQNDPGKTIDIYLAKMTVSKLTASKGSMMNCLRVAVVNKTAGGTVVGIYAPTASDAYNPLVEGKVTTGEGESQTEIDVYQPADTAITAIGGNGVDYTYKATNAVTVPVLGDGTGFITLEIYVWFEGQDADCLNAAADGGLGIEFIFGTAEHATSNP